MEILVIGNGYLGNYLASELADAGYDSVVASKNGFGDCFSADLGSLDSIKSLRSQLEKKAFHPKVIVHCASSGRGGTDAYRSVFVDGISHLIEVFPGAKKILTSSTSVYSQTDGSTVTEESEANPDRDTGKYLREAEDLVINDSGIVLRLAGIYGPGRSVHLSKMLDGTATIESGEVSRWLNQIHRDDAAWAILHFLTKMVDDFSIWGGEIFNVTDNGPMTQRECYETLARILKKPIPEEAPPDVNRKRAWTNKIVSVAKLMETGWVPEFTPFPESIRFDPRFKFDELL